MAYKYLLISLFYINSSLGASLCDSLLEQSDDFYSHYLLKDADNIFSKKEVKLKNDIRVYLLTENDLKGLSYGTPIYNKDGKKIFFDASTDLDKKFGVRKADFSKQLNYVKFTDRDFYSKSNLLKLTMKEYTDLVKSYDGKKIIWLDIESTGLTPLKDQITEIYATSAIFKFDKKLLNFKLGDDFHKKIKLTPNTQKVIKEQIISPPPEGKWTMQMALDLQRYDKLPAGVKEYEHERKVLKELNAFLKKENSSFTGIQNAQFDVNFINNRSFAYGSSTLFNFDHVFDTKHIIKNFWIPLVLHMAKKGNKKFVEIEKVLRKVSKAGKVYHSASMGVITKAVKINNDQWHAADADVKMMIKMYEKIFRDLNQYSELADLNNIDYLNSLR